jgi:hypothetical protein
VRSIKKYIKIYKDKALFKDDDDKFEQRDAALADLCLFFIYTSCPQTNVKVVPSLLQGHLIFGMSETFRQRLFRLRQFVPGYTGRSAWRKALTNHKKHPKQTAFIERDGFVKRREPVAEDLIQLMSLILDQNVPYELRDVKYVKTRHAFVNSKERQQPAKVNIPKISQHDIQKLNCSRRSVNPPILISLEQLKRVAMEVDQREAHKDFPKWMKPLNLSKRLERIKINNLKKTFMMDQGVMLDGAHHVVGMLSSGKSTLLYILLFALVGSGYQKRVLYLASDTNAAAEIVARLKAHGVEKATVISSFYNRDEHLSMIHWNAQGFPSDTALDAAACLTESLEIACPLQGFQSDFLEAKSHDEKLRLSDKPCHRLIPDDGKNQSDRTCPIIGNCPAHRQQRDLLNAQVVVMTPQALLHMTPDKTVLTERMSFPELFQFTMDVMLVDEADKVQSIFDRECSQEVDLLSHGENAFVLSNMRAIATAINKRSGGQYHSVFNARWHFELGRLQHSISAIYHVLLLHSDKLRYATRTKPFTGTSILADLFRSTGSESSKDNDMLEQVALLGSMLYGQCRTDDDEGQENDLGSKFTLDIFIRAFRFLEKKQDVVIDSVIGINKERLVTDIKNEFEGGCLSFLGEENNEEGNEVRALSIILSLLTNWCLSSFTYLVRNQTAVEDDFNLKGEDVFGSARRILTHYGSIIPRPMFGTVFGLTFSLAKTSEKDGGILKLVNHLGVGRYLLTHFNQLLADEGQAGPHVLMVSGTSWAGGESKNASPIYDVQLPVSAILEQPSEEIHSLRNSYFGIPSIGDSGFRVSGLPVEERQNNLRRIAEYLGKVKPSGTFLEKQWDTVREKWGEENLKDRRRALLVTNNYEDAKCVANELAQTTKPKNHLVYCLVSDQIARKGGLQREANRSLIPISQLVKVLPRSRVEEFGASPEGSVLVAPLIPISRGHNIITEKEGYAAVSTIYFLHRPHPRPDDYSSVIGMSNKLAIDVMMGNVTPDDGKTIEEISTWYARKNKMAIRQGFDLRSYYSMMSDDARVQFSWDLLTTLWQTIGRGIRKGVPVYVGFIDTRFAPGLFKMPKKDTAYSSCLVQIKETLQTALKSQNNEVAEKLYRPFYTILEGMLERLYE